MRKKKGVKMIQRYMLITKERKIERKKEGKKERKKELKW